MYQKQLHILFYIMFTSAIPSNFEIYIIYIFIENVANDGSTPANTNSPGNKRRGFSG